MKKNSCFVLLVAVSFVINGCLVLNPPRMNILNVGNDSLFYYLSCETSINSQREWHFPELWQMKNGEHVGGGYMDGVPELQRIGPKIESVIGIYGRYRRPRLPCNNKELHVFLFDRKTVDSYTWDEIKKNNLFDKHLVFSEDSLKKLKWKLELSND